MPSSVKNHWETIYSTKKPEEVSWTEEVPSNSLKSILQLDLFKDAHIADIGGGDSKLVDHLLELGYTNLTVVDISEVAIFRAKKRLGPLAARINWVVSNILDFRPKNPIDLWHDRATFHFLINPDDIKKYISILEHTVSNYVLISTFSLHGPNKCSGLEVKQYSEEALGALLENKFTKMYCGTYNHVTPKGVPQEFITCCFKRKNKE